MAYNVHNECSTAHSPGTDNNYVQKDEEESASTAIDRGGQGRAYDSRRRRDRNTIMNHLNNYFKINLKKNKTKVKQSIV